MRARRGTAAALPAVLAALLVLASGCGAAPPAEPDVTPPSPPGPASASPRPSASPEAPGPELRLPPPGAVVDYQLGGGYRPAAGVGGVVRDVTDVPATGLWSACYVNGFQTQPGDRGGWLDEHPDLVLRDAQGDPVSDPGWPDEMLLDTSTEKKRAAIATIVGEQITRCAERGFDAVELDNLDSWTRSHGRLTRTAAVDLAARLVAVGHAAGLAVAQKNASELRAQGRNRAGFDFAVTEECLRYDECAAYTEVYPVVLDVEYDADRWSTACADEQRPSSTVLRDHELRTPDQAGYVFETCR